MAESIPAPAASYPEGVTVDYVDKTGKVLNDAKEPLAARFRALFALRNWKDDRSVFWIGKALCDESALLKHELAYCLGQMQNKSAIPVLTQTLQNVNEDPMVRHEAGEALGAIGDGSVEALLEQFSRDPVPEVAETCQLALQRVRWANAGGKDSSSAYDSVDPTPADDLSSVEELGKTLIDPQKSLWERYKAMFRLRNLSTDESIKSLAQGLYCEDSALFRHEVAYVLGQIQSELVVKELSDRLKKTDESYMVRHECAEALGAIATPECEQLLREFAKDNERVVRESCEVALDMAEYENTEAFQYAKA